MHPYIGVLPLYNSENQSIWMNPMYLMGLEASGGLPAVLPLSDSSETWENLCRQYDGFVFTGGQDLDPALYGQDKLPQCGYQAPYRDRQELWMLRRLLELKKPVLGICRGIQCMNVALGGTLYQDLPSQRPSSTCHLQPKPFEQPSHRVTIQKGTLLHHLVDADELSVNSMHHQAVLDPAPGLLVSARAEDGLIEALEMPGHPFFLGVQWHPEHLWQTEETAAAVFRGLVDACIKSSH